MSEVHIAHIKYREDLILKRLRRKDLWKENKDTDYVN